MQVIKALSVGIIFFAASMLLDVSYAQQVNSTLIEVCGLSSGMTKAQIQALGVKLTESSNDHGFRVYQTSKLPQNPAFAESYGLVVDDKYGLVKIRVIGANITNDIFGTDGKAQFDSIAKALEGKYGSPKQTYDYIGLKLWNNSDEFYQCLAYDGCGGWAKFYESKKAGLRIVLELKGINRGVGYNQVWYEFENFDKAIAKLKQAKQAQTMDAL